MGHPSHPPNAAIASTRQVGQPWPFWHNAAGMNEFRQRPVLAAGLIVLMAVVAHCSSLGGGFVWDDDAYVTENQTLRTTDGLRRIWFEVGATDQYYPLVYSTFWVEYQLWGLKPFGYHLNNILLHALTAVLLWFVLRRLAVPGAWLAAAIFAVHPVHVESVAWVTERKNVLSGVFYMATVLAYLRFRPLNAGSDVRPRDGSYAWAIVFFVCALFSKTSTTTLPAALVLLVWWKRDRITLRNLLPLVPLFALAVGAGLITYWVERHHVGAKGAEWTMPLLERTLVAGRALWFYLGKLVWPSPLIFTYPRWQIDAGMWWQYVFPIGAVALPVVLWLLRRRIGKGPLVAILFFGGTLAPTLGLVLIYIMRYSFVWDHFQYLPSVGPIALAAAALTLLLGKVRTTNAKGHAQTTTPTRITAPLAVISILLLVALGSLTWQRGKAYEDAETLWRDTVAKNPRAWMAHTQLGWSALNRGGDTQAAMDHLTAAINANRDYAEAHDIMGNALAAAGRPDEAIASYEEALRIRPNKPSIHNNLGSILLREGRLDEAVEHLSEAVRLLPGSFTYHRNLGLALAGKGRMNDAIASYRAALETAPEHPVLHSELGGLLQSVGQLDEAVTEYTRSLEIDPNNEQVRCNLEAAKAAIADRDHQ